jgi:hypothetical protein
MKPLGPEELRTIAETTFSKTANIGLENACKNVPYIKRTIAELKPAGEDFAVVFSAGPSLHRCNPASVLVKNGRKGTVIATDGALGNCLRNGLVPDYVVSVDPDATRIVRWYGDPDLESRGSEDDYFRRQDLDEELRVDELAKNRALMKLVNEHAPRIKALLSTSISQSVTRRCVDAGFDIYWWNPLYDDARDPNSYSARVRTLTGAPCLVTGGNTGAAAWVLAHAVLGFRKIALVGMDLSYAPGTELQRTQYWDQLVPLFGEERVRHAYIEVHNPHLGQTWFTDPVYYWYREVFLQLARQADCETVNCSEGGILFGDSLQFQPFAEFLRNQT